MSNDGAAGAVLAGAPNVGPGSESAPRVDRVQLYLRIVAPARPFASDKVRVRVVGAPVAESLLGSHILAAGFAPGIPGAGIPGIPAFRTWRCRRRLALTLYECFLRHRGEGAPPAAAALEAVSDAGAAIVADTIAISLGFSILAFSQVPANARLGLLVAATLGELRPRSHRARNATQPPAVTLIRTLYDRDDPVSLRRRARPGDRTALLLGKALEQE